MKWIPPPVLPLQCDEAPGRVVHLCESCHQAQTISLSLVDYAAPKEDLALWILQDEVNRNEGSVFNYLGEYLGVEFKGVRHSP